MSGNDAYLFSERLGAVINPGDEPALLRLIHPCHPRPAEMLDEFGQCDPSGGVHVKMGAVLDDLLVNRVRFDTLRSEPAREELDEVVLELRGVVRDVLPCALPDDEHLAEMGLGLGVTFETVLVSALLLADLAVPSQTLQALGLHLVGEVFRGSDCIWRISIIRTIST